MSTQSPPAPPATVRIDAPRPRDFERIVIGGAILALIVGCYLVFRPFLTAFMWGAILEISTRGLYERVVRLVRGRRTLAAVITTLCLVLVLLLPIAFLSANLADQVPAVTAKVNQFLAGGVPEPPSWLTGLPLVGKKIETWWVSVATDPQKLSQSVKPLIGPIKDFLVAAAGGVGIGILQFLLALFIAGLLYVQGDRFGGLLERVLARLAGQAGSRQLAVVKSTVRGVFRGLLGTCAAQAILAGLGFWVAGVPGAAMLGMATFFLSIVPGGPVVLWLPAALWLNAHGSTGWAIFMGIWGLVAVSGSDNFIRPLLIGKGIEAPLALVFLGVIGGIVAFGFLGLFIGPVLLVVAYNLFQEWMGTVEETLPATAASPPR